MEVVGAALVAATLAVLGLWLLQGRLIFGKPTRLRLAKPGPFEGQHEVHELRLCVDKGLRLQGWVARPRVEESNGVILYFGGRNENVGWAWQLGSYVGAWTIYAFNYRGFGASDGSASESAAKMDAMKIVKEMMEREGRMPRRLCVMGRSLGTAVALHVAQQLPTEKVVLVSPFDSIKSLGSKSRLASPWLWLLRQRFECMADAQRLSSSALVITAEDDKRVPQEHSDALCAQLQSLWKTVRVDGTNHKTVLRDPATLRTVGEFLREA